MTDLEDISHYLGMQVNHIVGKKITLCQSTYLKKVLDHFKMTECKLALVPMNPRVANSLLPFNGNADKETIKWLVSVSYRISHVASCTYSPRYYIFSRSTQLLL